MVRKQRKYQEVAAGAGNSSPITLARHEGGALPADMPFETLSRKTLSGKTHPGETRPGETRPGESYPGKNRTEQGEKAGRKNGSAVRLPSQQAGAQPTGKESARKGVRGFFSKNKKVKIKTFVALAPEKDNLSVLLECIYTAQLIKKRHENFQTAVLVHTANQRFIEQIGTFDRIIPVEEENGKFVTEAGKGIRAAIQKLKPDILYSPNPGWKSQLRTLFSGARVKIGGARLRLVSRLLNLYDPLENKDLEKLNKKGADLSPEFISMPFELDLPREELGLPEGEYVWFSLYDDSNVTNNWPAGHAARLARLLSQMNVSVVVSIPQSRREELAREIAYLERASDTIRLVSMASPQERISGISRARAVVSAAGPETLLASLLGKPAVLLHDMRSYKNYADPRGLKLVSADRVKNRNNRNKAKALKESARKNPYYFKVADSLEKHIQPMVDECANDCPTCSFNSCMEFISPERVFENLKKILLPF